MADHVVKYNSNDPDPGEHDGDSEIQMDLFAWPETKAQSPADVATDTLAGSDPQEDHLSKVARLAGSGH